MSSITYASAVSSSTVNILLTMTCVKSVYYEYPEEDEIEIKYL